MAYFTFCIAASHTETSESGFVRASTFHNALAKVGHAEANVYPLPDDFNWDFGGRDVVRWSEREDNGLKGQG